MNTVSTMAENLIGSEIIKLAGEINEKIKQGQSIYNFTIGDFDPRVFPLPEELENEIVQAYRQGHTNYPPANGMLELRNAVVDWNQKMYGLSYDKEQILISGGSRPLIYAIYNTILDAGEKVLYPVPSWNNNHYTHLNHGQRLEVEATPENNFMPTAAQLEPHLTEAALVALCSPLNPTGTIFTEAALKEICALILAENKKREGKRKPLYLLYDQVYGALLFNNEKHYTPVELYPEMKAYTIFVDGISKAFAATGVRVGWAFGPSNVIDKMKAILSHIGAWSPKAEQVATAHYLMKHDYADFLNHFKTEIYARLTALYDGFKALKAEGFALDVIQPQAAIYLTVRFDLVGKKIKGTGQQLNDMKAVSAYLLEKASLAIVPFYAFGAPADSPWFRVSVGTCKKEEIPEVFELLRKALLELE